MSPNNFYFVNSNLNLDTVIKTSTWIIMRHQIHCELYTIFYVITLAFATFATLDTNTLLLLSKIEKETAPYAYRWHYGSYVEITKNTIWNVFQIKVSFEFIFRVKRWKPKKHLIKSVTDNDKVFFLNMLSFHFVLVDIICHKNNINSGRNGNMMIIGIGRAHFAVIRSVVRH